MASSVAMSSSARQACSLFSYWVMTLPLGASGSSSRHGPLGGLSRKIPESDTRSLLPSAATPGRRSSA
ncbi:hypothetical protein D3C81_896290 [compost metagenome]